MWWCTGTFLQQSSLFDTKTRQRAHGERLSKCAKGTGRVFMPHATAGFLQYFSQFAAFAVGLFVEKLMNHFNYSLCTEVRKAVEYEYLFPIK